MYYKAIIDSKRETTTDNPMPGYRHNEYREMGLTAPEFARCLPRAVTGELQVLQGEPGRYRVTEGDTLVNITTEQRPLRRVGSLELPVLGVSIEFRGSNEAGYSDFVARFERHFLRMGG